MRKILGATGEQVLSTATNDTDSAIPADRVRVKIRSHAGIVRVEEMSLSSYLDLNPKWDRS